MDWESFFMNVIIGAIIGAAAGLIGIILTNIFTDWRGYKKIESKIGDTSKASLSHQHEDMEEHLSSQHENMEEHIISHHKDMEEHLSGQISRNAELQETAIDGVSAIKDSLLTQKINEENRYNNLSEKQKDIKSEIDAISALQKDWERLNEQNKAMTEKISFLDNHLESLQTNYNNLSEKYSELVKENNKLKNINQNRNHGRSIPPISF